MSNASMYQVQYAYTADVTDPEQMSVAPGDMVCDVADVGAGWIKCRVIKKADADGSCDASQDRVGVIPLSYVVEMPKQQLQQQQQQQQEKSEQQQQKKLQQQQQQEQRQQHQEQQRRQQQKKKEEQDKVKKQQQQPQSTNILSYRVQYDRIADLSDPEQISIAKGEVVCDVVDVGAGWSSCRVIKNADGSSILNTRAGVIPFSYIVEMPKQHQQPQVQKELPRNNVSNRPAAASSTKLKQAKIIPSPYATASGNKTTVTKLPNLPAKAANLVVANKANNPSLNVADQNRLRVQQSEAGGGNIKPPNLKPEHMKYYRMQKAGLPRKTIENTMMRHKADPTGFPWTTNVTSTAATATAKSTSSGTKSTTIITATQGVSNGAQTKSTSAAAVDTSTAQQSSAVHTKYIRMQHAGLPRGAIENAMKRDQVDPTGFPWPGSSSVGIVEHGVATDATAAATTTEIKMKPEHEKYARMSRAGLPRGAIENAMQRDGVDPVGFPWSGSLPTTSGPSISAAATFPEFSVKPEHEKYARMFRAGLPRGALENAMQRDGVNSTEFPWDQMHKIANNNPAVSTVSGSIGSSSSTGGGGNASFLAGITGFKRGDMKHANAEESTSSTSGTGGSTIIDGIASFNRGKLRTTGDQSNRRVGGSKPQSNSSSGGDGMMAMIQARAKARQKRQEQQQQQGHGDVLGDDKEDEANSSKETSIPAWMVKARKASQHRAARTETEHDSEQHEQPKWASVKLRHHHSSRENGSHAPDDIHESANVPKSPALLSSSLPPRPGSAARVRAISANSAESGGASVRSNTSDTNPNIIARARKMSNASGQSIGGCSNASSGGWSTPSKSEVSKRAISRALQRRRSSSTGGDGSIEEGATSSTDASFSNPTTDSTSNPRTDAKYSNTGASYSNRAPDASYSYPATDASYSNSSNRVSSAITSTEANYSNPSTGVEVCGGVDVSVRDGGNEYFSNAAGDSAAFSGRNRKESTESSSVGNRLHVQCGFEGVTNGGDTKGRARSGSSGCESPVAHIGAVAAAAADAANRASEKEPALKPLNVLRPTPQVPRSASTPNPYSPRSGRSSPRGSPRSHTWSGGSHKDSSRCTGVNATEVSTTTGGAAVPPPLPARPSSTVKVHRPYWLENDDISRHNLFI